MSLEAYILGVNLLVNLLVSGGAAFFGAYLRKTGENLAIKDSIEGITRQVEAVKHEFEQERAVRQQEHELRVKQQDRAHQFRLAALDRRLQAHQEAFDFWWRLSQAMQQEPIDQARIILLYDECGVFWGKTCLYLSDEARDAFNTMMKAADGITLGTASGNHPSPASFEVEKQRLLDQGPRIVKASELQVLGNERPRPPVAPVLLSVTPVK